jgi:hypothetical protein
MDILNPLYSSSHAWNNSFVFVIVYLNSMYLVNMICWPLKILMIYAVKSLDKASVSYTDL